MNRSAGTGSNIMKFVLTSLTIALAVVFIHGNADAPQTIKQREAPDFKVEVLGYVVADFSSRVQTYSELRSRLEIGLPALAITDDPRQITIAEVALARRIRLARAEAAQGDIFTPAVSAELRKLLHVGMNAETWAAIMDDNPGDFSRRINGTYSKIKTLSTVPPSTLALLPTLPDDIEYRFVGRHLILRDTRANVVLDWMADAIRCAECNEPCDE
jgi:hypothetical protein